MPLPVRERLLRRLERRILCSHADAYGQCLNSPAVGSERCRTHGGGRKSEARGASVLLDILKDSLAPADVAAIDDVYRFGPTTLEDLIALLRLRVGDLERRYRDGFLTLSDYGDQLRSLTDQIRKLTESNSKIALNEALAMRNDEPSEEAFNPFAHFPPPAAPATNNDNGGES
jgi:hypothetical protein